MTRRHLLVFVFLAALLLTVPSLATTIDISTMEANSPTGLFSPMTGSLRRGSG